MSKSHLTYRVAGSDTGAALCGNNRRGYKFGLLVFSPRDFRHQPSSVRCQHCERLYLVQRNRVRRGKGLAPVLSPFDGLDHAL